MRGSARPCRFWVPPTPLRNHLRVAQAHQIECRVTDNDLDVAPHGIDQLPSISSFRQRDEGEGHGCYRRTLGHQHCDRATVFARENRLPVDGLATVVADLEGDTIR